MVACSPGFDKIQNKICLNAGLFTKNDIIPCPIDDECRFTQDIKEFEGIYVEDTDKPIINILKSMKRILNFHNISEYIPVFTHKPLISRTCSCWFI